MAPVLAPLVMWAVLVVGGVIIADLTGPLGWVVALLMIAVTTIIGARYLTRQLVRPLDHLAESLPPGVPPRTSAELASALTWEYRGALDKLHAAAAQGRRREAALAHTADGVVIVQPDGRIEYTNPTARMFLQSRIVEATGRLNQPDLDALVLRAAATGQPVAEDVTVWVPGAKPARARAVPLADGSTVLLLSDLSETYRLDRVRRDFVANVSHELKTPVAAIRALAETAETALHTEDRETAIRFVERLGTEAKRLADLVSDLLDLSRVEAGGDLVLSTIDLQALMEEAADRARIVGEVKEIEIVVHETPLRIQADASQLAMALKNLVDNAIRYSDGGKVELSAVQVDDSVALSVADKGIGIPSDELPRIFERFYRVDKARSRVTGGTGLGLAIVRHVVENHGGRIDAASELGVGSTFTITLPVARRNGDGLGTPTGSAA